MQELGIMQQRYVVLCDNESAIHLAKSYMFNVTPRLRNPKLPISKSPIKIIDYPHYRSAQAHHRSAQAQHRSAQAHHKSAHYHSIFVTPQNTGY